MRDPNPTVVLIPGLGMIAWGKNKSESRVTAEFYNCAIEVMRGAEAIDQYEAMDPQEAFDIEYWSLEEAKLRRLPPEKELDRQIVAVVGAGTGIGKAAAHRLVKEGAHVVCVDRERGGGGGDGRRDRRPATARASAWPAPGSATAARRSASPATSPTARASPGCCARRSWPTAASTAVVVTAGIFVPPDKRRATSRTEQWALTFGVNVTGAYIVADEANKIFQRQGLPASVVLTTSANAVVAKKGSLAYDTSKAAANHLVRELAVEMAPLVRVNARGAGHRRQGQHDVPARAGDRLARQVRDRLRASGDDRGAARQARGLLRRAHAHPARRSSRRTRPRRSCCWSRSASRKTTGHVIPVDGGLQDGFLR